MRVPVIDQDACTGCGICTQLCPSVFRMAEEEVAVVRDPVGASESEIQDAIESCPSEAIGWSP